MDLHVIQNMIYEFRGQKVMPDSDLAKLYEVETKQLVRQVKRNIERFEGEDFMFQLSKTEYNMLNINSRCQNGTLNKGSNIKYAPHVFTELGVAMLSSVLRSQTAIKVNREIMRAFVTMRHMLGSMPGVNEEIRILKQKMEELENNTLGAVNDLSEDTRRDLDDIYLALSQLAGKLKDVPKESERKRIGYK